MIPDEADCDWLDIEFSLGKIMKDAGLENLSDGDLQSLYQYGRNLRSMDRSLGMHALRGHPDTFRNYWAIQDAMKAIADFETHKEFGELIMELVDDAIKTEDERYEEYFHGS